MRLVGENLGGLIHDDNFFLFLFSVSHHTFWVLLRTVSFFYFFTFWGSQFIIRHDNLSYFRLFCSQANPVCLYMFIFTLSTHVLRPQ